MAPPARERRPPATTTAGTAWNAGLRPAQPARERRPPATTTAGTAWNAGLRPAQPAAGGRREGPPVPRWFLLVGNPGVRRDPYLGVAEPFAALRAPHRHPIEADGKEPPAALRAAVPAPTRRNVHDRVLRTPRRARKWRGTHVGLTTRHPPWFRAPARCRPEAGPVLPVGAPSRPRHGAIGYTRSHAHPSPRCGESGPSCDGEYEKFGLAAMNSLMTIASAVLWDRHPLVRTVRCLPAGPGGRSRPLRQPHTVASRDPGDATPFSTRHPLSAIAQRGMAGHSWLAAGQSE